MVTPVRRHLITLRLQHDDCGAYRQFRWLTSQPRRESAIPEGGNEVEYLTSTEIGIRLEPLNTECMVIHVSGEVDIVAAPVLRRCLDEQLTKVRSLVLDLTEIGFFGAAGLSLLMSAAARVEQHGVRWALICPHVVLRPLEVADLDESLPIYPNRQEAMIAVAGEQPALSSR